MIRQLSSLKYSQFLLSDRFSDLPFVRIVSGMIKRCFDVAVASVGLIFLTPIFLYIISQIKRDSSGPAFYWGPRAGMKGRIFKMLKFRTMYECEKSYEGPRVTCSEDSRITPLGHWLRHTKINELPQLWNVLIGDMSIVGPRPEDPDIAARWPEDAREDILSVRPGITSPASIIYHDEENLLSASNVMSEYFKSILPDKMRLDRLYVRNHSFFADMDIIFWTIAILLPRVVKTRIPEGHLFAGPLSRLIDRHVTWFFMDLFVAFGAGLTVEYVWRIQEPLNWGAENLLALSTLIAVLFSWMNVIAGMNRIVWSQAITEDAAGLMFSAALTTLVTLALNYLQSIYQWLPYPALPITMLFSIGLMASIGFVVVRYRWRLITGFASRWLNWRNDKGVVERVLIVGSGEGTNWANWLLRQGDGSRILSIVGIVDDEYPALEGMRIKGNRFLGGFADIPRLIKLYDVGVVLLAFPNAPAEVQSKICDLCDQANVRMVFLTDMLNTLQKQLTQPSHRDHLH
jgi:lipopolysaccharide/colanic/teichoic acid biosynthesis glycosyltransferase